MEQQNVPKQEEWQQQRPDVLPLQQQLAFHQPRTYQRPQTQLKIQQPKMQQHMRYADKNMKNAAIILFIVGFCLHFLGALTLVIGIGLLFLFAAFICDIVAFVCLCLI